MEPVIITRDNNPCNTFFVSVVSLEDHFTRSDGYVQVFNLIEQRLYNYLYSLRSEKRQEVCNTTANLCATDKCRGKTVIYGQKAA